MPKTANAFVADLGELVITISSQNVSDIAAFTTAEDITLDGALVSIERENDPEIPTIDANVTGDVDPIRTFGNHVNEGERWVVTVIDDYGAGAAGEWGTDNLSAVQIFEELYEARANVGGVSCTPAGGATGDIETTLEGDIRVLNSSRTPIDANAEDYAMRTYILACSSSSEAAHA